MEEDEPPVQIVNEQPAPRLRSTVQTAYPKVPKVCTPFIVCMRKHVEPVWQPSCVPHGERPIVSSPFFCRDEGLPKIAWWVHSKAWMQMAMMTSPQ